MLWRAICCRRSGRVVGSAYYLSIITKDSALLSNTMPRKQKSSLTSKDDEAVEVVVEQPKRRSLRLAEHVSTEKITEVVEPKSKSFKKKAEEESSSKRKGSKRVDSIAKELVNESSVKSSSSKTKSPVKKSLRLTPESATDESSDEEKEPIISPLLKHEQQLWQAGCKYVVGVDEAGRGPLAGPVVVAACAIDEVMDEDEENKAESDSILDLIDDSKKLSEKKRDQIYQVLMTSKHVHHSVAIIDHLKIDELNILQATLFGMDQVVQSLTNQSKCDAVLIDGPFKPPIAAKNQSRIEAIKGGDAKVRAIGAASIIAKVTRDRLMKEYHDKFPLYGFDRHKGYPVKEHVLALEKHGPCEIHRRSYAPVKKALLMMMEKKKTTTTTDDVVTLRDDFD